jgi:hypothetical protein
LITFPGEYTVFDAYTGLLMLSGVMLIIVGATLPGQSKGSRILNILVGAAYFGYGFYLEFIFSGDRYRVFFAAFLLPVLLIIQVFRARKAATEARAAQAYQDTQATQDAPAPQAAQASQASQASQPAAPATPHSGV